MVLRSLSAALAAAALAGSATVASAVSTQEGRMVSYEARGEKIQGYLVRPMAAGMYPGVVVIHEWWGLNNQIKGVAERLAEQGYVVIVPDLYRGKVPTDAGLAHELMRGLNENWAVDVIQGAVQYLRDQEAKEARRPAGQAMPVGTLGFCMGGRLSLAAGLKPADIQAVAMFYGSVETDKKALAPLAVPLLGIFGNEDRGIPLDQIKAFEAALKDAGKKASILVYPGVGHAFFNEERPGYDREVAADAWDRTKNFFKENLQDAPAPGAQSPKKTPPAGNALPD
jgi:carboxymethylenebutenolidase